MANWMNKRPPKGFHYTPTSAEHIANIFTHGIMIPTGFLASVALMMRSATFGLFFMAFIYGVCLVTLFSVSTAFHTAFYLQSNKIFELSRNTRNETLWSDVLNRCYIFFKSEGIVPFAHAIWHICVILGASVHYITVYSTFYANFNEFTAAIDARI